MTELKRNKTLYIQVASLVRSKIQSGQYVAGEKLPTENELCASFAVSKITVRKAIQILENQGLVKKIQGKGTFVQYQKSSMEVGKTPAGFSGVYSAKGHHVTNEFLQTKIIQKPDEVPTEMKQQVAPPIAYIQRIISEGDVPIGIDNVYVSAKKFPRFIENMLQISDFYKTLKKKYNITPKQSKLKLNGIVATEELADRLKCTIGDPLFVIDKIGYSDTDELIHFSKSIVRCDLVEYTFSI